MNGEEMAPTATWQPFLLRERALKDVEAELALRPEDLSLQCDRARLLTETGQFDAARQAYLDVLARAATHFQALTNLGTLLHQTGYRSAARTAYAEAAARHPDQPDAQVNLANVLRESGEIEAAQVHFEKALVLQADCLEAHRGLSHLFRDLGDQEKANFHARAGFSSEPVSVLPYRGAGAPNTVVMLISAAGGNLPIRHLLDDRVFQVIVIVAEFVDPMAALPPHALFINAIGDADLCPQALDAAARIVARTSARIVNHPARVGVTGRAANAHRLGALPGVVAPIMVAVAREQLQDVGIVSSLARQGIVFPFLLRSAGYHTGLNFVKVGDWDSLAAAAARLPGSELLAIQFLDARSTDGKIRKYRVMIVDEKIYPLHVAISRDWKVHYFTAEMADDAGHRAEDEAFLTDMSKVLGARAMAALEGICDALALDYGGIDFSLDASGDVLLYEANANMTVPPPDPDPRWNYRHPAVQKIHNAVRALLTAGSCGHL